MTAWASRRLRLAVAGLLILFLLLATVYNAVSPPFEAPDEIGHFYYVVHLLQSRRLPVVPASEPPPHYEHEGIQPPLYYAGAALFVRALSASLGLDLVDAGAPLERNPHSTCAQPGARYNVTYFAHDPHSEQFPYAGRVRMLHIVRLWSSLLGMATVAGVFAAVRLAFPSAPAAAWLAAGLTAFTPTFLFTTAAASNDNLVTAMATWGIYLALRLLRDGLRWPHTLALGLLAGLAALSKFSGALLLPLALVVIPLAAVLRQPQPSHRSHPFSRWTVVVGHWSLLVFPFLAVAGWWLLRNWTLYGDLTGTRPMLDMLPLRREMSLMVLVRELPGMFRSWWGAFGCTAPPTGFHLFYLVPVLGGLAGLVADRRELRRTWPQVGVLLVWLGLMGVAYVRWNWVIHASKGRLLYPAIVGVAGFLGRGWATWTARRRGLSSALLVSLALGAAVVPVTVIAPRVSPPPIYTAVADVQPQHELDGRFGSEIALLGYDLDGTSFEPGEPLDLTLYWHVLAQPAEHYGLAIQLVSAVPGETATLINFNTWTGGGSYPTAHWRPGEVIADHYRLRIPDDVVRAQSWYVQVILYDGDDGDRLPFALDGQRVGKTATLAPLRVGAASPEAQGPPEVDRLVAPIQFDGAVALDGVRVTGEGEALDVTFWWRSVAPLAGDYVVFVHLYDAEGQLVADADAPPLSGGFPTSMWRPGDRVRDARTVSLPSEENAPFRLAVGWYDPVTGVRLPGTGGDGAPLPDDAALIPISR
jgi:hypothetical protein